MPILFIGSGLILILTGIKGHPDQLWKLFGNEFVGKNNFAYWIVSILVLGSLGYVPQLRNLSRLFLGLVVLVLLLDNKGFFAKLQDYINTGSTGTSAGAGTNSIFPGAGGGIGSTGSIPDPFQFKMITE